MNKNQLSAKETRGPKRIPASEILEAFFKNLKQIEGMDEGVANLIQDLWKQDKLSKEELLKALNVSRKRTHIDG